MSDTQAERFNMRISEQLIGTALLHPTPGERMSAILDAYEVLTPDERAAFVAVLATRLVLATREAAPA